MHLSPGIEIATIRGWFVVVLAVVVTQLLLQLLTSAVLFWRRRDRLFLALTLVVCAIVGLGATLAGAGG